LLLAIFDYQYVRILVARQPFQAADRLESLPHADRLESLSYTADRLESLSYGPM